MIDFLDQHAHAGQLLNGCWGLEKESHRITRTGALAMTPHPAVFGNKLHHPSITVDFAESQLELVTPPLPSLRQVYDRLLAIHEEAESGIGDEWMWPLSMPPALPEEEQIPIARYDDSHAGRVQEIYRRSLALRYGKKMQMISGVHYNFSFSSEWFDILYRTWGRDKNVTMQTFSDHLYFALARNFLRFRWLLIYLFGASPSVDASYQSVISKEMSLIRSTCPACSAGIERFEQYAVSLRVSRFGYSNSVRRSNHVSFNSLDEYIAGLRTLMTTVCDKFEQLGMYKNGKRVQLNANVLQTESEFYSPLRLKQPAAEGEDSLDALEQRGVKYAEVRLVDLNPYERAGIGLGQLHFLHLFMLYCLFEESPPLSNEEDALTQYNHHQVSLFGRKPGLKLQLYPRTRSGQTSPSKTIPLAAWGAQIFDRLEQIATRMSEASGDAIWVEVVRQERVKLEQIDALPSAQMMQEMAANEQSFLEFGLQWAQEHRLLMTARRGNGK